MSIGCIFLFTNIEILSFPCFAQIFKANFHAIDSRNPAELYFLSSVNCEASLRNVKLNCEIDRETGKRHKLVKLREKNDIEYLRTVTIWRKICRPRKKNFKKGKLVKSLVHVNLTNYFAYTSTLASLKVEKNSWNWGWDRGFLGLKATLKSKH